MTEQTPAPRCWCGGEVGPRVPGDARGLGCLEDLHHDWRCNCFPEHGPNDECTCPGCWACSGHVMGCTCDIAWDCEHKDR